MGGSKPEPITGPMSWVPEDEKVPPPIGAPVIKGSIVTMNDGDKEIQGCLVLSNSVPSTVRITGLKDDPDRENHALVLIPGGEKRWVSKNILTVTGSVGGGQIKNYTNENPPEISGSFLTRHKNPLIMFGLLTLLLALAGGWRIAVSPGDAGLRESVAKMFQHGGTSPGAREAQETIAGPQQAAVEASRLKRAARKIHKSSISGLDNEIFKYGDMVKATGGLSSGDEGVVIEMDLNQALVRIYEEDSFSAEPKWIEINNLTKTGSIYDYDYDYTY